MTVTTKIDVFLDSNIPVDEPITCVYDPSDEQDVMPLSCLERDYQVGREQDPIWEWFQSY